MADFNTKINELALGLNRMNSFNIKSHIKNDALCRLIVDKFEIVTSLSILLYDSQKNALVNSGHYLNAKRANISFNNDTAKKFESVIKNKILYDYLYYKETINEANKINFKEFSVFVYNTPPKTIFVNNEPHEFNKETFEKFLEKIKIVNDLGEVSLNLQVYHEYRHKIYNNDIHPLECNLSKSAEFFVTHYKKIGNIDTQADIQLLVPGDIPNKTISRVYNQQFFIQLSENATYLLIPLIAYDRWIGIARALLNPDLKVVHSSIEMNNRLHGKEIKGFISMFSLLIANEYPPFEYFYKGLYDRLNRNIPQNKTVLNDNLLKDFCECLAIRINCRATLIRFGNNENILPKIQGWTETVEDYVKSIFHNDYFSTYANELNNIFNIQNYKKNSELLGILFHVNSNSPDRIEYLYSYDSDMLHLTYNIDDILTINPPYEVLKTISVVFNQEVYKILADIKVDQFLVIRIPYIKNGYISFGNTKFRKFVEKDIAKVYQHIHRFGSELIIKQENELAQKEESFNAAVILFRNLYHSFQNQLKNIVGSISLSNTYLSKIKKHIDDEIVDSESISECVNENKLCNNNILASIDTIYNRLDQYAISENINISPHFISYNLSETIVEISDKYINKTNYPIKYVLDEKIIVNYNQNKLTDILTNLIDNAMKFSFTFEERMDLDPDFNKNKVFFYIVFELYQLEDEIIFDITNWGKRIPIEYKESIFEFGVKCPHDGVFVEKESLIKGGLGLKFARKSAELINARIEAIPEGIKTTIRVTWKKM